MHPFRKAAGIVAGYALLTVPTIPVLAQKGRPAPIPLNPPVAAPTAQPITIGSKSVGETGVVPKGFTQDAALVAGLKMPLDARVYHWMAGQSEPVLPPSASFICVLTGVSGNFAGGGEHVILGIEADTKEARWVVTGTSGQKELSVAVTCVSKNRFTPGMLDPASIKQGPGPYHLATTCNVDRVKTGYPSATTALFIRELAGAWRGGGEQVRIVNADMMLGGCSGGVGASAGAIGFPGPVQYLSVSGRTPIAAKATLSMSVTDPNNGGGASALFSVSSDGRALVPYDRALCGLVGLAGKFQGYGERVSLEPRTVNGIKMWWLELKSSAKPSYLSTMVRCIARDQRAS